MEYVLIAIVAFAAITLIYIQRGLYKIADSLDRIAEALQDDEPDADAWYDGYMEAKEEDGMVSDQNV